MTNEQPPQPAHTPGPWRVEDRPIMVARSKATYTVWQGSGLDMVCVVAAHDEESKANARLIAAAPALLSMLERVAEAEFGFGGWPTEHEVRSVIAAAAGERPS